MVVVVVVVVFVAWLVTYGWFGDLGGRDVVFGVHGGGGRANKGSESDKEACAQLGLLIAPASSSIDAKTTRTSVKQDHSTDTDPPPLPPCPSA